MGITSHFGRSRRFISSVWFVLLRDTIPSSLLFTFRAVFFSFMRKFLQGVPPSPTLGYEWWQWLMSLTTTPPSLLCVLDGLSCPQITSLPPIYVISCLRAVHVPLPYGRKQLPSYLADIISCRTGLRLYLSYAISMVAHYFYRSLAAMDLCVTSLLAPHTEATRRVLPILKEGVWVAVGPARYGTRHSRPHRLSSLRF